jgi:hypothetical protein
MKKGSSGSGSGSGGTGVFSLGWLGCASIDELNHTLVAISAWG